MMTISAVRKITIAGEYFSKPCVSGGGRRSGCVLPASTSAACHYSVEAAEAMSMSERCPEAGDTNWKPSSGGA